MSEKRHGVSSAFHQARWCEPLVSELSEAGARGVGVPDVEADVAASVGETQKLIPPALRRHEPPDLPELGQPQVVRHFLRLAQETLGGDLSPPIGFGTCTMKYAPKAHDRLLNEFGVNDIHPLQPQETIQGLLEIVWRMERILCSLSGMSAFNFSSGGGTHGIYANARIVRAHHAAADEADPREEIVTTLGSHPGIAAAARTAGYKVVTLMPEPDGLPSLHALRASLSERTAGLFITNPEDTGIFNPTIDRIVESVHAVGGLCAWDQANANGLLGIVRARDVGFDLCQFNLHKTFGSPHGAAGLSVGAIGCSEGLVKFLPVPRVVVGTDGRFGVVGDEAMSIGHVRSFFGNLPTVVRAYMWTRALGAVGLTDVARTAVLNNNYLRHRLAQATMIEVAHPRRDPPLEQTKYDLRRLRQRFGVGTMDVARRTADYGVSPFFTSHHPWTVEEPATLEPTETVSRREMDDYVSILMAVETDAAVDWSRVAEAPHKSAIHRVQEKTLDDPSQWAVTWRAFRRKVSSESGTGRGRAAEAPSLADES